MTCLFCRLYRFSNDCAHVAPSHGAMLWLLVAGTYCLMFVVYDYWYSGLLCCVAIFRRWRLEAFVISYTGCCSARPCNL